MRAVTGAWLVLFTAMLSGSRAPVASISGVVVEGEARRPVPFAHVGLAPANRGPTRTVVAGENGAFTFDAVSAGSYFLAAKQAGYLATYYQGSGPGAANPGPPLVIAPDDRLANIELTLVRGGVISGRVVDQYGDPAVGVEIDWSRAGSPPNLGPPVYFNRADMGRTDAHGAYRLFDLLPGEYLVSANAHGNELRLGSTSGPRVSPVPVFPGGVIDPAQATPITVGLGEERTGVDITLQMSILLKVEGTIVAPPGIDAEEVQLSMNPTRPELTRDTIFAHATRDGRFVAEDVQPGEYTVSARARRFWAAAPVTVLDRDVSGVALVLQPTMAVTGRATMDSTGPAADLSTCWITLARIDPATAIDVPIDDGRPGADGMFTIGNVTPGRYRFVVGPGPGGTLRLVSATIGGTTIGADGFEVRQGVNINRVVLTIRSERQP